MAGTKMKCIIHHKYPLMHIDGKPVDGLLGSDWIGLNTPYEIDSCDDKLVITEMRDMKTKVEPITQSVVTQRTDETHLIGAAQIDTEQEPGDTADETESGTGKSNGSRRTLRQFTKTSSRQSQMSRLNIFITSCTRGRMSHTSRESRDMS